MDKLACSHSRAWEYYAESIVRDNTVFKSLECVGATGPPYSASTCTGNQGKDCSMGYWANTCRYAVGFPYVMNYYLGTNAVSPYSLS